MIETTTANPSIRWQHHCRILCKETKDAAIKHDSEPLVGYPREPAMFRLF
jgi:hypothetical protein